MHGDRVYTITAGDPSRGMISLSGEDGPAVGTRVQFYARQRAHPDPSSSITFLVSEETRRFIRAIRAQALLPPARMDLFMELIQFVKFLEV